MRGAIYFLDEERSFLTRTRGRRQDFDKVSDSVLFQFGAVGGG